MMTDPAADRSSLRIVSLIASATEIICRLGYRDQLVGRSHECDFPPQVNGLPICSESKVDVHAASGEIDRAVRELAASEAVSVYRVDAARLDELAPTHIVTQTQCEVCAVSLADVEAAVCEMVGSRPQIVSCEPMVLEDVWADIRRVADAFGDPTAGERLVRKLRDRLAEIQGWTSDIERKPSILCLEWLDPLMTAANWVPELVEIAGGTPLLSTTGQHSPYITWEDLHAADPDVIALMPCGFDMPRTFEELSVLTEDERWQGLRAVRSGRVFVTDGNAYFNRPGPRLVESAAILFDLLHGDPSAGRPFRSGLEQRGWIPLAD